VTTAKAVLIFLVSGLLAGLCFKFFLSRPTLHTFWFIKGDKFLIPTYRYYAGVGVFLLLGLAAGYSISRFTGLFRTDLPLVRKIISSVVVVISALLPFVAADTLETRTATAVPKDGGNLLLLNIDPIALYFWGFIGFVLLISIACWILTAKLYYLGVFLNFLALPVTLGVLYIISRIADGPSITYPVYFSLLSSSCGFWIAAAQRIKA